MPVGSAAGGAGWAPRPPRRARRRSSTSDIRAWAQEQGYEVSSRGRVSSEIREAYEAAH